MQFGAFSVSDVTPDPTSGRVPAEHERIMAMVTIARKAEEAGLDVFASGEVVPVLRKEMAARRPPGVPGGPAHEARLAATRAEAGAGRS